MKIEIEIPAEVEAKIDKLVKEKKYKDVSDFARKAVDMMVLAEEQAKLFKLGA